MSVFRLPEDKIVWKKALAQKDRYPATLGIRTRVLVKLLVTKNTQVYINQLQDSYNPESYKCRAARATVLGVYTLDGKELNQTAYAGFLPNGARRRKKYVKGQMVRPHSFDKSDITCAPGIHFFTSMKRARSYSL